ncbi:hypothetical protein [Nocardia puris]|uniref:Uncharacterized protein n=1 Tax=Nocardia puris TaxID=208602 RepID=A0A366D9X0_9NOCA|nr:hypothetical protein [Nocardia puris]RBO86833.1 hypothetical protein DFR74_1124 [Nocardia puris]
MNAIVPTPVSEQAYIEGQYADILTVLSEHGYDLGITTTGGGCYAIMGDPIAGRIVCITDRQGPLAEERAEQTGWAIGIYNEDQEDLFYEDTTDSSPAALLALLDKARGAGTFGMVDISGLAKADVLAAIYNASAPLGLGQLDAATGPAKMTSYQARPFLESDKYFEYLYGRPLKLYLGLNGVFDPDGYDSRNGGPGTAQRVIERLRQAKIAEGAPEVEHIFVNRWGEFEHGCLCGNSDFYTVLQLDGRWIEIEPVTQWDGWACSNCFRIFNEYGETIARPEHVDWRDDNANLAAETTD